MATTLITTSHGIGLGIMGQSLIKNVKSINKVLARDLGDDFYKRDNKLFLNFDHVKELSYFTNLNPNQINSSNKDLWKNDKVLYIENSYGFSKIPLETKKIYIPMWEQKSVFEEVYNANQIISVCDKSYDFFLEKFKIKTDKIPFPIEVNEDFSPRKNVKNILHNAGSLGGNLRKGTIEAIRIFQKSGVSKKGIKLIIHCWVKQDEEFKKIINFKPDGIIWTDKFILNNYDLYQDIDLLLFPSKLEGHAMVVLESHSFGIPALCTNYQPMSEYEEDEMFKMKVARFENAENIVNGPYSYVDVEEAAEKLKRICEMDLTEKSAKCYENCKLNYSWASLREVYNDLLN